MKIRAKVLVPNFAQRGWGWGVSTQTADLLDPPPPSPSGAPATTPTPATQRVAEVRLWIVARLRGPGRRGRGPGVQTQLPTQFTPPHTHSLPIGNPIL